MKRLLPTLVALLLWLTPAFAATYYVNGTGGSYQWVAGPAAGQASAAGNDSTGNGSIATPYATMTKTESIAAASGDSVWVAGGTIYSEDDATLHNLKLVKGTTWNPDGIVTVKAASSILYVVVLQTATNTVLTGNSTNYFIFDGQGTAATSIVYLATGANGKTMQYARLINPKAAGGFVTNGGAITTLTLDHNSYTDGGINATAVYNFANAINGTLSITDETATLTGTTRWLINNYTASATPIFSFLRNTASTSANPSGVFFAIVKTAQALTMQGNTLNITGTTHTSDVIDINTMVGVIVNTWTINATSLTAVPVILKVYAKDATNCGVVQVTNNVITHGITSAVGAKVIEVGSGTSAEWGAGSNNMLDGAIITGNSVFGPLTAAANGAHGILYGYNKNGIIAYNWSEGNQYGIVIKGDETYTSGGAYYNVLVNNPLEFMRVKGVKNLPVYNNSFFLGAGQTVTNGLLYITINSDSGNATSTGTIAKNNIFYSQSAQNTVNSDAGSSTGLTLDHNLHFVSGGNPIQAVVGATTYTAWATWQGAGYDANSPTPADPLFVSTVTPDFHLQATSPAKDAGVDVGLTQDYDGNLVPSGSAPDLGAYELQQSIPGGSFRGPFHGPFGEVF